MAEWSHNVCERDWFLSRWGVNPDGTFRNPMRMKVAEEELGDVCCVCGVPTVSGIYVREDENNLLCKGQHDAASTWSPVIAGTVGE